MRSLNHFLCRVRQKSIAQEEQLLLLLFEIESHMSGNFCRLIVYYQHGSEQKLMVSRSGDIEVAAYHHSSRLGHSCHSSVDVVHVKGTAEHVRSVFKQLQNTPNVDKVSFISAPMREEDCC